MKQIPNLFTLLNLFFGCIAIIIATQSNLIPIFDSNGMPSVDPTGAQYINLPEKIAQASLFIFIAAVIDFLDGFVARAFNSTSEMGKQLDSLADLVSFGVAPSIIIYHFLQLSFVQNENALQTSMIWLLPSFILPCAGAYRLARFNIDKHQNSFFRGLPIPAVGLLVASFPLIYWYSDQSWIIRVLINQWFWYALILFLSYLMISKIPLMALKFKDFSLKNNSSKYFLIILSFIAVIVFKLLHAIWFAVPVIFIFYLIISALSKRPDLIIPQKATS